MKIPSFFRRRKGGSEDDDDFDDDDFDDDLDDGDGGERGGEPVRARETGGTTVLHDDDLEGDDDLGDDLGSDPAPSVPTVIAGAARGDGLEGDDDLDEQNDGDLDDDVEFDDEDEGTGAGISRTKLIAIAGGGTAVLVLAVVLGAWLFLGGEPEPEQTAEPPAKTDPARMMVELPPKVVTPLAPPTASNAAAPNANTATTATPMGPGGQGPAPGHPATLNAFASSDRNLGAGIVVPPMTPASFVAVPLSGGNQPLSQAPDPALVEDGVQGQLPKKAGDGRLAWQVYARPLPPLPEGQKEDRRARVAIIVRGLGLSQAATEAAIRRLPGTITLAFDSEAPQLGDWAALARRTGHEVLVQVPMESANFPEYDPGPNAISTLITPDDNVNKLEYHLSRMTGYVGILTTMGSAFTINEVQMKPVLDELLKRGLMYVDSYTTLNTLGPKLSHALGVPSAYIDIVLDETLTRAAIDRKLADLVAKAKRQDGAIGVTDPLPIVMERIGTWANAIPKENADHVLVPVSAIANIQPVP